MRTQVSPSLGTKARRASSSEKITAPPLWLWDPPKSSRCVILTKCEITRKGLAITTMSQRTLANLILLLVTIAWGITFSLTKGALAIVAVFPYLAVRFLLAATVMVMMALARPGGRNKLVSFHVLKVGFALGVLLFLSYALQTLGLQSIEPAISAFLTGLNVVLVPLLAIPLLGLSASRRTWFAVFTALLGLALLDGVAFLSHWSLGSLYTVGCAVFIALQIIYVDKWAPGIDPLALATVEIITVALLSLITTLFLHTQAWSPISSWLHPMVIFAVVLNGLFGTAFAYWAQAHYQQKTSASYVALIFTLEPVFAAIIAVLFFGEPLTWSLVLGGFLIISSMLLADDSL
ncbi:EamA family transporter [Sulfobacillus sp. hq2]|nr:EamA family transporter [Sulfobacillus sp. hq2]